MAALIRRKAEPDRDEIPPGTLYLLILKTLAVGGRLHGYEIAESIQSCSDDVLQIKRARCTRRCSACSSRAGLRRSGE